MFLFVFHYNSISVNSKIWIFTKLVFNQNFVAFYLSFFSWCLFALIILSLSLSNSLTLTTFFFPCLYEWHKSHYQCWHVFVASINVHYYNGMFACDSVSIPGPGQFYISPIVVNFKFGEEYFDCCNVLNRCFTSGIYKNLWQWIYWNCLHFI